ncbi:FHA domain-containing protein [Solirubrobacter soli]|uniref:FHA domain-containing protein n=1 Tax=Solirubrobacter soli TaxID=363832 RepID=UPI000484CC40|nr:FHA domain-containing protein [Solirubrobacter soli]
MRADAVAYDLLLPDHRRVKLTENATIGRGLHNTVMLDDPSVSRTHARIFVRDGTAVIEDAASSYGTFLNGHAVTAPEALADGARIRLGDTRLVVERRRPDFLSGRTRVVPAIPHTGQLTGVSPEARLHLRPGWALKRLDADEGPNRFVLKDLDGGGHVRLGPEDAALFEQLDGETSLAKLREEACERFGPYGEYRLAALVGDLSDAGLLVNSQAASAGDGSRLARLLRPRELATAKVGGLITGIYSRGGWLVLTRPMLLLLAVLAVVGLPVFAVELFSGSSTPLFVNDSLSLGALALLFGRLALVVAHELAHGLVLAATGRSVSRGGLRFILVVPYAFVDTSDAWFERRAYRIAIAGAGPASDLAFAGLAAILSATLSGTAGEVAFQVAIAGYLSAFFNLNPLLERDGYHIAIDLLREPDLRRRARAAIARRIAGQDGEQSRVLRNYGIATCGWTLVALWWALLSLERHRDRFEQVLGNAGTTALFVAAAIGLSLPLLAMYVPPLLVRFKHRRQR